MTKNEHSNLLQKSTTLGALSGDITPTHGDIWLNDYNLATHPKYVDK